MINGAHVIVSSKDAEADRAFFHEVLGGGEIGLYRPKHPRALGLR